MFFCRSLMSFSAYLKSLDLSAFVPKLFTLWQQGIRPADIRADLLAGLTVAVVALPLSMALAIASGASPDKGLITAVVAGGLISLLGGSRVQIGGPTGAFVVVVFNVIAVHGYDGLVLATFLAGLILMVAGYLKLGQVIRYIPHPVVTGFTSGIAVVIATSQVKDFFGLTTPKLPGEFIAKWQIMLSAAHSSNLTAVVIGVVALGLILTLRKVAPKWPGYLIAIVATSVLVMVLKLPIDTVGSRFPDMPTGLPLPQWPQFNMAMLREVTPSAFTIAFLAGIEALLSCVVADGMTGFRHRSNQELVAQGVANLASGLMTGLPATGAIARTATNIRAGGKTPLAGIFHALFILLFMLFAAKSMQFVPMAALAAILFIVAYGMSEVHRFVHILKLPGSDRVVMVLTFLLTVMVDLTVAIGVGVTLASLLFMARMSRSVSMGTHVADEEDADYEVENARLTLPQGVEVFHIAGPVFFGVADELMETLKRMGQLPKVLIIRMRLVPFLDASGAQALESLVKQCAVSGTQVVFSGLQSQPKRMLSGHAFFAKVMSAPDYKSAIAAAGMIIKV
jgi:SulP family sulfate permease